MELFPLTEDMRTQKVVDIFGSKRAMSTKVKKSSTLNSCGEEGDDLQTSWKI